MLVAPSGECSRGLAGAVDQPLCAVCGSSLAVLNLSLYIAALWWRMLDASTVGPANCAVCQQL